MENLNTDKQPNQIKRNPTRFNTNVKEGKTDEKTFDSQTGQNRNVENNSTELANDETNLDRSGIGNTTGSEDADFSGGEKDYEKNVTLQGDGQVEQQQAQQQSGESSGRVKNDASQAGSGSTYGGGNERETESEISHKGQVGGQAAHNLGGQGSMGNIQRNAPLAEGKIDPQHSQKENFKKGNQQGSQFNQEQ